MSNTAKKPLAQVLPIAQKKTLGLFDFSGDMLNIEDCRICNLAFHADDGSGEPFAMLCPDCTERAESLSPAAMVYSDAELLRRWNEGLGL